MPFLVKLIDANSHVAGKEPEAINSQYYALEDGWYHFYSYVGNQHIQIASIRAEDVSRIDAV